MTICTNGRHITELHIEGDRYFEHIPEAWVRDNDNTILKQARQQIAEYFAGTREVFELPLLAQGTSFQQKVWRTVRDIAYGTTSSYAQIADKIGKPRAARAVGTAIGRNPICLFIPCHRVLTSGGSLGGYVAGLDCKRQLLATEGVSVLSS